MNETFNPAEYGFSNRYAKKSKGGIGRKASDESWVYSNTSGAKKALVLKFPPEIGERIVSMFGEEVGFDHNDNGEILLWKDNYRKVSRRSDGGKWSISIDMACDDYIKYMGSFDRLYMDVHFFADRVLFTPNGKRKPKKEVNYANNK